MTNRPYIVGIGGTARAGSSTEQALRMALLRTQEQGSRTRLFGGAELLHLPHYLAAGAMEHPMARALVEEMREADAIVIASPGYHGGVSGLVKNALDYTEEMARDPRPYFDGLPVGLITTAHGWQAACNTLDALRSIAHALRGWPTPLGVAVNTAACAFGESGCSDPSVVNQLQLMTGQILDLAKLRVTASLQPVAAGP